MADNLTRQGVLADPQELSISLQAVCPAFLQRKKRAKDKNKDQLTKKNVRLMVNFGPINKKINDDVFNQMGRLRVMMRRGQGLLGQSEEFTLLIKRIIKEDLQEGKCYQIINDIITGGATQEEAAANYIAIIEKFQLANIKVAARKTHIFPKQVDVLGLVCKQGRKLQPSPHRRNALVNTKQEDIKKVTDMRSWLGLYKTLIRSTPNVYRCTQRSRITHQKHSSNTSPVI